MRKSGLWAAAAAIVVAMPAAAQDWASLRDALLAEADTAFVEEGYHAIGFTAEGALDDGDSTRVTLALEQGAEVILVGVCDGDCSDLDLTVFDPGGKQLASDLATDDVPIVRVTPGRTGAFSVSVQMAECSVDPCSYALQTFTK